VTVQISNFHQRSAGLHGTVLIGNYQRLAEEWNRQRLIEAMFVGIAIAMALYHFALWAYQPREMSLLYFVISPSSRHSGFSVPSICSFRSYFRACLGLWF
jgi:hypothetical protein